MNNNFLEKANKLTVPLSGKNTAFWFYLDFIEFKLINHRYGMDAGDRLLQAMEDFLGDLPGVSLYERVFSDKFVFAYVSETPQSNDNVTAFWKENSKRFIDGQIKNYPECNIRICCGICPMEGEDAETIIDDAALACKEARKLMGHEPIIYTPAIIKTLDNRRKREMEILQSLNEGRFTYFLQPIVDLLTGKIVGAEALARQISPDGEIIYPDAFLPIMEESGDVIELDFLILRKVCQDIADRISKGLPVVRTAVNLSRLHINYSNTAEKLHAIAQEYNVAPELLDFELTETIPLEELSSARELIDKLRGYNYQVSIDDYGSGYTGITVWQDLDFDTLKMDRKFLSDDITLKVRNTILIPSTIDLAQKMNINVICEGVERVDQYQSLLNWGCHTGQGFYFSKPIPVEEFYDFYVKSEGKYPLPINIEIRNKDV